MTDIIIHNHDDLAFSGTLTIGGSDADTLIGTEAADIIVGYKGADIIEGGAGDDLLIGGELHLLENGPNAGEYTADAAGADTFVFNFGLSHSEATTYYFRPNAEGTNGDTPNINGNLSAWQNYMDQLAEWRSAMSAEFGVDADQSMTGDARYTVKKAVGSLGQFDNSFTVGGEGWKIDSHDGTDTILQFGDGDALKLNGLSGLNPSEFDDLFDVTLNAHGDTVLSWTGGSITIDGMSIATMGDFYVAGTAGDWFA
jgi:hypothetical protein